MIWRGRHAPQPGALPGRIGGDILLAGGTGLERRNDQIFWATASPQTLHWKLAAHAPSSRYGYLLVNCIERIDLATKQL